MFINSTQTKRSKRPHMHLIHCPTNRPTNTDRPYCLTIMRHLQQELPNSVAGAAAAVQVSSDRTKTWQASAAIPTAMAVIMNNSRIVDTQAHSRPRLLHSAKGMTPTTSSMFFVCCVACLCDAHRTCSLKRAAAFHAHPLRPLLSCVPPIPDKSLQRTHMPCMSRKTTPDNKFLLTHTTHNTTGRSHVLPPKGGSCMGSGTRHVGTPQQLHRLQCTPDLTCLPTDTPSTTWQVLVASSASLVSHDNQHNTPSSPQHSWTHGWHSMPRTIQ